MVYKSLKLKPKYLLVFRYRTGTVIIYLPKYPGQRYLNQVQKTVKGPFWSSSQAANCHPVTNNLNHSTSQHSNVEAILFLPKDTTSKLTGLSPH